MKQHKWHKEIKAWADGATIQFMGFDEWVDVENDEAPEWHETSEYRIKPQPKEPQYLYVYLNSEGYYELDVERRDRSWMGKIKLEVDDETS